jgi:diguanylate cyclase (GGDEF)-like protein/PAS domain S-box-containing protein
MKALLRDPAPPTEDRADSLPEDWLPSTVLEAMPDAVAVISEDGTIAKANRLLSIMFEYEQAELVGSPLDTLIPGCWCSSADPTGECAIGTEQEFDDWESLMGRRKSGGALRVEVVLRPLSSAAGAHKIAVIRRVTDVQDLAAPAGQQWLLQTALENMSQGFLMFDGAGRIAVCNRRYIEMYGLSTEVVKPGCTLRELISHRKASGLFTGDVEQYCAELEAALADGKTVRWVVETSDGRSMNILNRPIAGGGWVVTHEDITDRVLAEKHMAHMALHDSLTDLPNRSLFRQRLDKAVAAVRRSGALAVLFLDLDNFKLINDTFGHLIGDELLKQLAQRLQDCVREADTLARLGGDEFAIVQTALTNRDDAARLAGRIGDTVRRPLELDGRQTSVDFSVGIAVAPEDGFDSEQLLKNADLALYAAKADGRGRFRFFAPEMGRIPRSAGFAVP